MNDTYQPSPDDVEAAAHAVRIQFGQREASPEDVTNMVIAALHARGWRDAAEVAAIEKERALDRFAYEETIRELAKDRDRIRAERDALDERCREYKGEWESACERANSSEHLRKEAVARAEAAEAKPATADRRRDTVECYVCGGNGGEQVGPISDEYDGDVQTRPCYACHGNGRLDLDAVRELVDTEAFLHDATKSVLGRKIEECDSLRIAKRSGWVLVADRLPDDPREVLVLADDIGTDYHDGWTALAWSDAAGRWIDGATGKEWAHRERITMWHEIAGRPRQEDQARAMQALDADTAEKETRE